MPGMADDAQTASQTSPEFKTTFAPELISVAIIESGNIASCICEYPKNSLKRPRRLSLLKIPDLEGLNFDIFDMLSDFANLPISSSSTSNANKDAIIAPTEVPEI